MNGMDETARRILRANDRGGYTVPTARLYPFQWNWDSALVAMGWATFDERRGWQELEMLVRGQWDDGLIPQIVFHAPSEDYFPGPEVWGTRHTPPTSGITQPPILATAVRAMLEYARRESEAEARAAALYSRLLASHRWWARARDPGRMGLVATLHPWETGMDNSPAWDAPLARVPDETSTPIVRRDTGHVDPGMRPRAADYRRYIHLVDLFRALGWNAERMLAQSPFRVADIGTNAILLRAEKDLHALARRFGSAAEVNEIEERTARQAQALRRLWREAEGLYFSFDLIAEERIAVATSAGLLPIFAGESAHAGRLAEVLAAWSTAVGWPVPSTAPQSASFEARRYWRGPVWPCVNWMLADGFSRAREAEAASRLTTATKELISRGGFFEYFDPRDGTGLGGSDFSWTAAVWLLLGNARA
jgi:hypothetical protein